MYIYDSRLSDPPPPPKPTLVDDLKKHGAAVRVGHPRKENGATLPTIMRRTNM